MVLLQHDQLLLQRLDVALQMHADNVSVVQEFPQPGHVGLHGLAHGHLVLHPGGAHHRSSN